MIETNAKQVNATMVRLFLDQVPYATSRALNTTVLEAQKVQRAHQRKIFKVRNARFIDQSVKVRREDFATKRNPVATMRIEPPGGAARADVITKFEAGGLKTPTSGTRLSIPIGVRKGASGVPKSLRPRALGFKPHGRSGKVFKGHDRTFMIRTPKGGIILQRTGQGRARASSIKTRRTSWKGRRSGVRVLYGLTPRARIGSPLDFYDNAARTVQRVFPVAFATEFHAAVRTAR